MHKTQQRKILDRLDEPEVMDRWLANSKSPVLVISREPGCNPGVTIHLSGIGANASSPMYRLGCGHEDIKMLGRGFSQFKVLSPPSLTRISECDAVDYTASFRSMAEGPQTIVRMRMVAIFQCPAFYTLRMFDTPILSHPEVEELTLGGIMHEGLVSMVLGLSGMPAEAEDVMTSRDIRLAEATGGRIHLMNMSTAGSVELIRRAKDRGTRVTAEVCPINFSLTDEHLRSFDSNYKVNPPLRSAEHVEACIRGLVDGTIDVIASGHAPRASEKKMQELDQAPFGVTSLETVLPLVITKLIEPGHLSWSAALAKLTCNPARILGLANKGTLRIGADADVTIIDPAVRWTVQPERFRSQSQNTPFGGVQLTGRAWGVIVGGVEKVV